MSPAPPELSIVIPAFNEELELPTTIAAIRAAADKIDNAHEIIVVDDASTDATAQIARQAGARIVSINRPQIAAARNAGARVARGNVLLFVDADVRSRPRCRSYLVDAMVCSIQHGSERRQELSRLRRIDQGRIVAMLRRRERRYARQRR